MFSSSCSRRLCLVIYRNSPKRMIVKERYDLYQWGTGKGYVYMRYRVVCMYVWVCFVYSMCMSFICT